MQALLAHDATAQFLARSQNDGAIVGVATLVTFPIPTTTRAWVEDVIVDEASANQGIGRLLVEAMVAGPVGSAPRRSTSPAVPPARPPTTSIAPPASRSATPTSTGSPSTPAEPGQAPAEPRLVTGAGGRAGRYDRSVRGSRRRALLAILLASALVTVACANEADDGSADQVRPADGFPEWPAPADPMERTIEAGLTPEVMEHLQTHRHSHLDVFVDGVAVPVPAGIGIDITDPGVKRFPDSTYGGIEECDEPCISPLHTHDETGIIHTEAAADTLLTLGQLFTEWGVVLQDGCVGEYCEADTDIAVYIGGDEFEGNPADIELDDQLVIAIVIGTPPDHIPARADFSQA